MFERTEHLCLYDSARTVFIRTLLVNVCVVAYHLIQLQVLSVL